MAHRNISVPEVLRFKDLVQFDGDDRDLRAALNKWEKKNPEFASKKRNPYYPMLRQSTH